MYRPDVTYFKVGLKWFVFTLVVLGVTKGMQMVLGMESVKGYLLGVWPQSATILQAVTSIWVLLAVLLVVWLLALRWFLIDCIKL